MTGDAYAIQAIFDRCVFAGKIADNTRCAIRRAAVSGKRNAAENRQIFDSTAVDIAEQAIAARGRASDRQIFDSIPLSVKDTLVGITAAFTDGCPVLIIKVNILAQNRIILLRAGIRLIHLLRQPGQLIGVFDLIVAIAVFRRLRRRRQCSHALVQ